MAAAAVLFVPGAASPHLLPKWGGAGFLAGAALLSSLARGGKIGADGARFLRFALIAWLVAALTPLFSTPFRAAHAGFCLSQLTGIAFFAVALLAFAGPDGQERGRRSLLALSLAGAALGLYAALQQATLLASAEIPAELRAPATFGNPNTAAAFFAPLSVWAFASALEEGDRRRKKRLLGAAVATLAGTVATLSKGSLLALALATAFFLTARQVGRGTLRKLVPSGLVVAALVLAATVSFAPLSSWPPWLTSRAFLWKTSLALFWERPLAGWGLGSFPAAYPLEAPAVLAAEGQDFTPRGAVEFAHSEFFGLLAEAGLIGSALLFAFAAITLCRSARERGVSPQGAALTCVLANGAGEAVFHFPATVLLWWLLAAAAVSPGTGSGTPSGARSPKTAWVLGAFSLLFSLRLAAAEYLWTAGAGRPLAHRAETLEDARRLLPENPRLRLDLARSYAARNEHGKALAELGEASRLSFDLDGEYLRVRELEELFGAGEAERAWRELSERFPAFVRPRFELGRLARKAGRLGEAKTHYGAILAQPQRGSRERSLREAAERELDSLEKLQGRD